MRRRPRRWRLLAWGLVGDVDATSHGCTAAGFRRRRCSRRSGPDGVPARWRSTGGHWERPAFVRIQSTWLLPHEAALGFSTVTSRPRIRGEVDQGDRPAPDQRAETRRGLSAGPPKVPRPREAARVCRALNRGWCALYQAIARPNAYYPPLGRVGTAAPRSITQGERYRSPWRRR